MHSTLITSHHITPHHTTPHHTTPHYITLHYITLHYITIHYTTSRLIAPHDITPHDIQYVSCLCSVDKPVRFYSYMTGFNERIFRIEEKITLAFHFYVGAATCCPRNGLVFGKQRKSLCSSYCSFTH